MKKFTIAIILALSIILTSCGEKVAIKDPKIYEYEANDFKFDYDFSDTKIESVSEFSDEDLEIQVKEVRNIENSFVVLLDLKNISDGEIFLVTGHCAVNGFKTHAIYEKRLKPGESDNARLIFFDEDLNKHMIESVNEIEISFGKVKNNDFSKFIYTDIVYINLDGEAKSALNYKDYDLIYDKSDIKIYNLGLNLDSNEDPGYDYMVFIENNSDRDFYIETKAYGKIEGTERPFYFAFDFPPKSKEIAHIYFFDYEGDKNLVSEFEIEFDIKANDETLIDSCNLKFKK